MFRTLIHRLIETASFRFLGQPKRNRNEAFTEVTRRMTTVRLAITQLHDGRHVSIVPATPRGLQQHPQAVLQEISPAQDSGSDVHRPQWPATNVH